MWEVVLRYNDTDNFIFKASSTIHICFIDIKKDKAVTFPCNENAMRGHLCKTY